MTANFMKREEEFTMADKMLAMFTHARINGCDLGVSARELGYSKEELQETVRYRIKLAFDGDYKATHYRRTIEEGCRRLAATN